MPLDVEPPRRLVERDEVLAKEVMPTEDDLRWHSRADLWPQDQRSRFRFQLEVLGSRICDKSRSVAEQDLRRRVVIEREDEAASNLLVSERLVRARVNVAPVPNVRVASQQQVRSDREPQVALPIRLSGPASSRLASTRATALS